jgi:hypothetical protein
MVDAGAAPVKSDTLLQPESIKPVPESTRREKAVAKRREIGARCSIVQSNRGIHHETSPV